MVAHSNPWAGINLAVDQGDERVSYQSLSDAFYHHEISPLNSSVVDSNTTLHFHSCGLGNNNDLISLFADIFNDCQVNASTGYVNFSDNQGFFTRNEMKVFYAFYPTAYRPANLILASQLSKRYPEVDKDWLAEIEHSTYQYNIPVEWEIKYPEYDVPELLDELDRMEWLLNQDELMNIIEKTEIPFDYFRWIIKRNEDSIKVYGKVTVLCVMESINA